MDVIADVMQVWWQHSAMQWSGGMRPGNQDGCVAQFIEGTFEHCVNLIVFSAPRVSAKRLSGDSRNACHCLPNLLPLGSSTSLG